MSSIYQHVCWEWERDDSGSSPYSPLISYWIETTYANGEDHCGCAADDHCIIDFASMLEIDTRNGVNRRVKRVGIGLLPTPEINAYWVWCECPGKFTPYTTEISNCIEMGFKKDMAVLDLSPVGFLYTIDYDSLKQISQQYGTQRDIQRIVASDTLQTLLRINGGSHSSSQASGPAPSQVSSGPTTTSSGPQAATISGPAPFQSATHTSSSGRPLATGHIPSQSSSTSQPQAQAQAQAITVSGRSTNRVSSKSSEQASERAMIASYDMMDDFLTTCSDVPSAPIPPRSKFMEFMKRPIKDTLWSMRNKFKYPLNWKAHSSNEQCLVVDLEPNNKDYCQVELKFRESLPDFPILSIKRVQNCWLWVRYTQAKTQLQSKGAVNEMELFHGSRTTSSDNICSSEEGFDMRFSRQCLWGQANYFAVEAYYSHHYAYLLNRRTCTKEIILAKVLTGDSIECDPDSTLRFPPEKQNRRKIQLKQVRYDSVNGLKQGYRIYMTYANDRAYPAYVITYKDTEKD